MTDPHTFTDTNVAEIFFEEKVTVFGWLFGQDNPKKEMFRACSRMYQCSGFSQGWKPHMDFGSLLLQTLIKKNGCCGIGLNCWSFIPFNFSLPLSLYIYILGEFCHTENAIFLDLGGSWWILLDLGWILFDIVAMRQI